MKKNYSYIWISLIVLIFGIYFVPKIVNRFKDASVVESDRLNVANRNDLLEVGKAPSFSFTNQNNEIISNKNYEGKVYLVEFFFSTCPTICPIMNENMVKIQNEFQKEERFGIVSITIDPETDTPENLKQHAKFLGATMKNWNFLTGKQDDIFALSKKFNLYVGENSDAPGGFEHSGLFALVDKNGMIRARDIALNSDFPYYDGTNAEGLKMLKEDIQQLIKE
ncbi:SCO family protein [Myroides sp. JBRI-B21084]|uniref:SCO family protein n=1 Tax=Myroides sp. JBRI-B21084 TaxID=3119977 RepID=UPI0026E331BD|nr:SCO family protein [Paenimyroides cloacae]WKW47201.1 SCO family protein [Paenimyroides cloacae]